MKRSFNQIIFLLFIIAVMAASCGIFNRSNKGGCNCPNQKAMRKP